LVDEIIFPAVRFTAFARRLAWLLFHVRFLEVWLFLVFLFFVGLPFCGSFFSVGLFLFFQCDPQCLFVAIGQEFAVDNRLRDGICA
jgi:hypothetical protein